MLMLGGAACREGPAEGPGVPDGVGPMLSASDLGVAGSPEGGGGRGARTRRHGAHMDAYALAAHADCSCMAETITVCPGAR